MAIEIPAGGGYTVVGGGPAGIDGKDGVDGTNGTNGRDGTDGKQGQPGQGTVQTRNAATDIPPSTLVVDQPNNTCAIADPTNMDHQGKLLGLVVAGVSRNSAVPIQALGPILGVSGTFGPGDALFIGDGTTGRLGSIVNVSPAARANQDIWRQQIGTATTTTQINLTPGIFYAVPALGSTAIVGASTGYANTTSLTRGFLGAATSTDARAAISAAPTASPNLVSNANAPAVTLSPGAPPQNLGGYGVTASSGTYSLTTNPDNTGAFTYAGLGYGKVLARYAFLHTDRLDIGVSPSAPAETGIAIRSLFYLEHREGGGTGVVETLNIRLICDQVPQTQDINRNRVALRPNVIITAADPHTGYFAMNPCAIQAPNAGTSNEITGAEVNVGFVPVGSATNNRLGWSVVSVLGGQGTNIDAGYSTGTLGVSGFAPFRDQYLTSDAHGGNPFDPNGTFAAVRNTQGAYTFQVQSIFDFSILQNQYILRAPLFAMANDKLTIAGAGARIDLGASGTANTPTINLHSSANANDYDARIYAGGGGNAPGSASLIIAASEFVTNCQIRPITDNAYSLGNASNRWSQLFAGTQTISTSDGTLKKDLGTPDDALLDAVGDIKIVLYQFLAAIAEKGADRARIHCGVIAQQLASALAARGLDPVRYGFWCRDPLTEEVSIAFDEEVDDLETYSEDEPQIEMVNGKAVRRMVSVPRTRPRYVEEPVWQDEAGTIPVMIPAQPARFFIDKDGKEVSEPATEARQATFRRKLTKTVTKERTETRPVLDAQGNPVTRLGVRYEQLEELQIAYVLRELRRLADRVTTLEHPPAASSAA